MPIPPQIRDEIQRCLDAVARERGVRILHANKSGSRTFPDFFDAELPRIEALAGSVPTPEQRDPAALDRLLLEIVGTAIGPVSS